MLFIGVRKGYRLEFYYSSFINFLRNLQESLAEEVNQKAGDGYCNGCECCLLHCIFQALIIILLVLFFSVPESARFDPG